MNRAITYSFCLLFLVAFSFSGFAQEISNVTSLGENNPVYHGPANHGSSVVPCTEENPNDFTFENGLNCSSTSVFQTANDLTVAADEDFELSQITASIFTNDGINVVEVIYYDDAAGLPGAVIGSEAGIVPTSQVVIGNNFGIDVYEIVLDFTPFTFAGQAGVPTTYWVELSVTDGVGGGNVFWVVTSSSAVGLPAAQFNGGWLIFDPGFDGVYIWGGDCTPIGGGGGLAFFDDFEAGLGNWTITNDGGTCVWEVWDISTNSYTMPPAAMLNVMAADADECGPSTTTLTTATAGPFDATGMGIVTLAFDNDWRTIASDDEAHVEVSTDGGGSWSSVVSWVGVDQRNTSESFDISSMVAGTSFMVRFRTIQPGFDWWWAVDNVAIDGIVPVELTSFAANVNENNVTLNWTTATELNNQGFDVERNSGNGFEKIGFVAGFGTSTEIHTYSYVDGSLQEGTYTYRLKQVDFDGTFEYSDVVEVDVAIPAVFALEQNYPNPFNPSTTIKFSLAADSKVTLTVFDILGQEVANLISGNLAAGSHEFNFNASNINSGVYFYRINATGVDGTNFTSVKKMILTK